MTENSKKVLDYVKLHDGEKMTVESIAAALGMKDRSVQAIITSSFQRHKEVGADEEKYLEPIMVRVPVEEEVVVTKTVNYIELTDFGRSFTPAE